MNEINRQLMGQFFKTQMLLNRIHAQNSARMGLWGSPHRGQGRILALLKEHPEISQKQLGELLEVRPQSLGEMLAKLESSGMLYREPSAADRRVMMIYLTEAGEEAAKEIEASPDNTDAVFASLDDPEKAVLGEMLSRLIEDLEKKLQAQEKPRSGFGQEFSGSVDFGSLRAHGSFRMRHGGKQDGHRFQPGNMWGGDLSGPGFGPRRF